MCKHRSHSLSLFSRSRSRSPLFNIAFTRQIDYSFSAHKIKGKWYKLYLACKSLYNDSSTFNFIRRWWIKKMFHQKPASIHRVNMFSHFLFILFFFLGSSHHWAASVSNYYNIRKKLLYGPFRCPQKNNSKKHTTSLFKRRGSQKMPIKWKWNLYAE